MSASLLFGMYQSIAMRYDAQSNLFAANQSRLGLANQTLAEVSNGTFDPARTAALDRHLELQSAHSRVMFAASQAMEAEARQRLKESFEAQKRSNEIWYGK